MIVCISSASQFNILEANKVKGLVVLNKTYRPFSFMSPPNSIALVLNAVSQGAQVGILDRQNERDSSFVQLAHTSMYIWFVFYVILTFTSFV